MEKIGILTFQNTLNYGAVLQALALEMKIKQLGGNCEIINYHCMNIELREHFKFPQFGIDPIKYAKSVKSYLNNTKRKKMFKSFMKKNMLISKEEYNKSNIKQANKYYNKFIVGSDMVWELGITGGDTTFYLDFADANKRYSYAASLGVDKIDDKYIDICKTNLNKFKHISVRETQAEDYLNTIIKNEVSVDIDPTLLHDGSFWEKYEEEPSYNPSKKYILLYFLDKEGIELETAKKIAKEKDYEIIILSTSKEKIDGCTFIPNASVGEFLYYIHNAELVITGSYHGMIFSMNYNTNFMYFNRANSTRMESIAKITNSTNRRLTKDSIPQISCDFSTINNAINMVRMNSIKYLKSIVDDEKR